MLSQPGSTVSSNLQRAKSTTSVKERRKHPLQAEPINPQTARTYALIAANRAVDRSRASHSADLARSESIVSRKSIINHREHVLTFSPASHLRQQRSTLRNLAPKSTNIPQLPAELGQGRGAYDGQEFEAEFGIFGENYGALPSSYRRLKRSKSLLTPTRSTHRSLTRTPETTLSQAPSLRTAISSTLSRSPSFKVRIKRSFNFLRPSQSIKGRVITAPAKLLAETQNTCHPEAVELAKKQFSESSSSHVTPLKTDPIASKTNRVHKAFRKTFRTTNAQKVTLPLPYGETDATFAESKPFSSSLSDKVKKLFTKPKQNESLPPQQLNAVRSHFDILLDATNSEVGFDSCPEPDTPATGRTSIYIPSEPRLEMSTDIAQLSARLSRSASADSLSSKSKSRVTSWTNSTTTGSLSSRPPTFEPKRLSIIREDGGPHQPSSSAGRHIGGVSIFQQPLNVPEGQMVNSHRVYSALVKRIEQEHEEMERTKAALKEIHDAEEQDDIVGHYLFSAPTIRRVKSSASTSLSKIEEDNSLQPRGASSTSECSRPATLNCDLPKAQEGPVISCQNENKPRFYPFPSGKIAASRTPSGKIPNENKVTASLETSNEPDTETGSVIAKSSIYRCLGNQRCGESTDSIYSRTTNGGTNADYTSPLASMEDFRIPLGAVIGTDIIAHSTDLDVNRHDRSSGRYGVSDVGTSSGKDTWKGWMEHQMETLEQKQQNAKPITHFREHAQIDSEDTEVGSSAQAKQVTRTTDFSVTRNQRLGGVLERTPKVESLQNPGSIRESRNFQTSLLQLREVPRNHTPAPSRNPSIKRSQSALLNQEEIREYSGKDNRRTTGLKRISSSNIANLLKVRKSQPILSGELSSRKENDPTAMQNPPPVSTPGRHERQDQLQNGKSSFASGRLYNHPTTVSNQNKAEGSSSESQRTVLSARLSRPFDMDIPERNRPFDSTYLGKREVGNGSRLSVAPNCALRRPKTYGDLDALSFANNNANNRVMDVDSDATALPALKAYTNTQRAEPGHGLAVTGKRIVSSFLRSRRKSDGSGDSPAFV